MAQTEIKHHLTDALLMAYSAGTLPEAFSLVVATHISMCDECRARMAEFDAVGGEVLGTMDSADLSEDAFGATLALIAANDAGQPEAVAPQTGGAKGVFPAPLQDWVGGDLDSVKWRGIGGGVKQAVIETSGDETVRLLSIPGGVAMPDHGHGGTELTLVLQGAFVDEDDRFGAGDVEVADEHMEHTPIAEPGMDCICLAATDARLKFKGIVPRVVGRMAGI